ncbi:MAG: hypothetical protein J7K23_03400 [Thermoproteales archaeon]|nr:hypothetical protein [Thermoproteales archaeon]
MVVSRFSKGNVRRDNLSFTDYLWRLLVSSLILVVFSGAFGFVFGVSIISWVWSFVSCLLIVVVLSFLVRYSRICGFRLAFIIFIVFFGVYTFNTQVETIFFGLNVPIEKVAGIVFSGLFSEFFFSLIFIYIMDKKCKTSTISERYVFHFSVFGWLWRFFISVFLYVFLYIIAGMLVFPYIQDFYAGIPMPDVSEIILMQFFRGFVYLAISILVLWVMDTTLLKKSLFLGLLFSVLGGIAPLLLPNPYMPAKIRFYHSIEIGLSNFIYGVVIGYVFCGKKNKYIR